MPYCNRVVVQAPGKVNLALNVNGTDGKGYHLLEMIMQSIDLSDILLIGRRDENELRVTCSSSEIPEDDTNIVHRAAEAFFRETGVARQGLSIHIDKRLPVQAGLAGGSADAAAVLCGMNRLFETGLDTRQLCDIGLACGADVPFCIVGGCCLAQGVGELLTPLPPLPDCILAVAKPPQGMSTRVAFTRFDEADREFERANVQDMQAAIMAGDLAGVGRNMGNVLQQANTVEEVEVLHGIMLCDGALGAVMTGTGTAVVGLFENAKAAKSALRHLREQVAQAYLTKPIGGGAVILHES